MPAASIAEVPKQQPAGHDEAVLRSPRPRRLAVSLIIITVVGLGALTAFLASEGRENADQWSSVLAFYLAVLVAVVTVVRWLWREDRKGAEPALSPLVEQADPISGTSADSHRREVARAERRPYYERARQCLQQIAANFDEVLRWVVQYAEGAGSDRLDYMVPKWGPVLHVPRLGPLVSALQRSIDEGYQAVEAMEWSGLVPLNVAADVRRYVMRAETLLDTVRGAYVSSLTRREKWVNDANDLRFVIYWRALNAMKNDLQSPSLVEGE